MVLKRRVEVRGQFFHRSGLRTCSVEYSAVINTVRAGTLPLHQAEYERGQHSRFAGSYPQLRLYMRSAFTFRSDDQELNIQRSLV